MRVGEVGEVRKNEGKESSGRKQGKCREIRRVKVGEVIEMSREVKKNDGK